MSERDTTAADTSFHGDTSTNFASFGHERAAPMMLERAVPSLRKAIEDADLWVLHEIDPQAILRCDGRAIGPARQILFFHPRLMMRLLAADAAALLEAPLKFALLGRAGPVLRVRWLDPEHAFGRYGQPALAALGRELSEACARIVDAAFGPDAEGDRSRGGSGA